jgi:hypothetical protein
VDIISKFLPAEQVFIEAWTEESGKRKFLPPVNRGIYVSCTVQILLSTRRVVLGLILVFVSCLTLPEPKSGGIVFSTRL